MRNTSQSFSSGRIYRKTYNKFKGIDMTTDPAKVADYRSPMAVNMISEAGGLPEKRTGWRVLRKFSNAPVNGLFSAVLYENTYYFAHVGTEMYVWGGRLNLSIDNAQKVGSSMNSSKSCFFTGYADIIRNQPSEYINQPVQCVFVLDGSKYWVFTDIPNEDNPNAPYEIIDTVISQYDDLNAYVPKTSIRRSPDGTVTTPHESVNLCGYGRWNYFDGDGTSTVYKLDTDFLSPSYPVSAHDENMASYLDREITFTIDHTKGTVTFSEAPPAGTDNVRIIFGKKPPTDINACTIASKFTIGAVDNRVVLSGHPKFPNYEWISAYNNCTYFPDNNYNVIGMGSTAVMGYASVSDAQIIFKESDGQSPTVFMRTYTTDDAGNTVFIIKQGCAGYGAVSKHCIDILAGEPLFLSESGVIGLALSDITQNTSLQNRSFHIDAGLCRESGLQNAVCCVCKGFLYIFINSKVYILDGVQEKVYRAESVGDYAYECFYWDNVPAYSAAAIDGSVWFGASDGRVCRFNDDWTSMDRFNDYTAPALSGLSPVSACWATKLDQDDYSGRFKTLLKKGPQVSIKPYSNASVSIIVRTDSGGFIKNISAIEQSTFDWADVNFEQFLFGSLDAPYDIPVSKKMKNYRYIQFIVKNSSPSEGFGVYSITKYYSIGNYLK